MKQTGFGLSQKFAQESAKALTDMKATGTGHTLDDIRVYFAEMKRHRQGHGERPAMLQPKTMR